MVKFIKYQVLFWPNVPLYKTYTNVSLKTTIIYGQGFDQACHDAQTV